MQMVGGSGNVQLESLSPPVPGGPVLRVTTSGPTGVIRVHHPESHVGGLLTCLETTASSAPVETVGQLISGRSGIQPIVFAPRTAPRRSAPSWLC